MRITKLVHGLLVAGIALGVTSCKKENDPINVTPNPPVAAPIHSLYQALKPTPQTFTVNAGTAQTITGAKGTMIFFNPTSFKNVTGQTITSGSIKIELTEALTPGNMIMNRVTTVTDANNMLRSGGSINIVATLNNTPVSANNYRVAFPQASPSSQPMALFTGIVTPSGLNEGAVIWSNTPTNPVAGTVGDSMGQGPTYYMFDTCTSFNWINCDYFWDAPDPKTNITVVMPDGTYNDSTTNVYVVFPSLNAVASVMHYDATTHAFSFSTPNYYCPVGMNVKVMIMGIKNNAYFYDLHSNLTVTSGLTVTANPATTTLSALQAVLAGL